MICTYSLFFYFRCITQLGDQRQAIREVMQRSYIVRTMRFHFSVEDLTRIDYSYRKRDFSRALLRLLSFIHTMIFRRQTPLASGSGYFYKRTTCQMPKKVVPSRP